MTVTNLALKDCVILYGPELIPHRCHWLQVKDGAIAHLNLGDLCTFLEQGRLWSCSAWSTACPLPVR